MSQIGHTATSLDRGDDDPFRQIGIFARALADGGLEDVCIAPGARSTPLTVAFARANGIRCWSHIDERSASFFALGIAKRKRMATAIVCTSGTAAANFYPAVIEAAHARVPLVVLTADRPAELRDRDAGQAIDQIKLYGDYPLWFAEVGGAGCGDSYFADLARRALQTAQTAPRGVVHLNFPLREPLLPTPPRSPADERQPNNGTIAGTIATTAKNAKIATSRGQMRVVVGHAAAPAQRQAERLANSLRRHPRGLILCGPSDHPAAAQDAIAALAHALGFPVLADPTSQMRGTSHDAVMVDTYEAILANQSFATDNTPDVVLRFGSMPLSKPLRLWLECSAVPHIVVEPRGLWNDPSRTAREIWHTDVELTCEALLRSLSDSAADSAADSAWGETWRTANRRARRAIENSLASDRRLSGAGVVHRLYSALPVNTILYIGNSLPIRQLEIAWPDGDTDVRVLCNRGANGIDGVVSSILGAAADNPQPVVGVLGDLSFYHDMNGLMAARRHPIDATIVVLNNDGGGIFSMLPQAELGEVFDEYFTTPHGLDFGHAATLYGCAFTRTDSWSGFATAIARSLGRPGLDVIEVAIDRNADIAVMRDLVARGAAAVSG